MMTWTVGAGFDPGWRSDGCGGCIVLGSPKGVFYVASTFERTPQKGRPLVPSVETAAFCELAKRYDAKTVVTDSFYVESVREHVRAAGLWLNEAPSGAGGKATVYAVVRDLLHAGRVRIPAKQLTLIRQLREVMTEPLSGGGVRITSPRRSGAHGDLCSAFVLAVWSAARAGRRFGTSGRSGGHREMAYAFASPEERASSEWDIVPTGSGQAARFASAGGGSRGGGF